jgi:Mitochondrial carrier protein
VTTVSLTFRGSIHPKSHEVIIFVLTILNIVAFSAGALSGIVSTFIATPSDMVKTRILTNYVYTYEDSVVPSLEPDLQYQPQSNGGAAVLALSASNSTVATSLGLDSNEEFVSWSETPPSRDDNPLQVAKKIVEQEGLAVLFTGVYERCGGAIPRFGITLGAHEWLEHYASSVGLLSQ